MLLQGGTNAGYMAARFRGGGLRRGREQGSGKARTLCASRHSAHLDTLLRRRREVSSESSSRDEPKTRFPRRPGPTWPVCTHIRAAASVPRLQVSLADAGPEGLNCDLLTSSQLPL